MRKFNRSAIALSLVATFALSACGSKEEAPIEAVQDNFVTEVPADEAAPMNVDNAVAVPVEPANVATKAAPPPAFTDKQQISDDADATGMTARIQSDDATGSVANEMAPVQ